MFLEGNIAAVYICNWLYHSFVPSYVLLNCEALDILFSSMCCSQKDLEQRKASSVLFSLFKGL